MFRSDFIIVLMRAAEKGTKMHAVIAVVALIWGVSSVVILATMLGASISPAIRREIYGD
jgi:hypothetical protein